MMRTSGVFMLPIVSVLAELLPHAPIGLPERHPFLRHQCIGLGGRVDVGVEADALRTESAPAEPPPP